MNQVIQSLELEGKTLNPPLFIGGEGRSGTRLLRNILGKHKSIFEIKRESYVFVSDRFRKNKYHEEFEKEKDYDSLVKAILASMFYRRDVANEKAKNKDFSKDILEVFSEVKELDDYKNIKNKYDAFNLIANYLTLKSSSERWVEKTPFNIYCTDDILSLYPKAKVVAIYRDPRAVCASWLKKDKLKSLIGVCLSWNKAARQMEMLSKSIPNKFYIIRFEDLVEFPERELRKLCEFIGEDFDESMLDIDVTNTHFDKPKESSGFSKEVLNRWQSKLTSDQKYLVDMFTSEYRKKLRYSDSGVKMPIIAFLGLLFHVIKELIAFPVKKIRKLFRSY